MKSFVHYLMAGVPQGPVSGLALYKMDTALLGQVIRNYDLRKYLTKESFV